MTTVMRFQVHPNYKLEIIMKKYQTNFKALGTKITLTVFNSFDQQIFAPSKQLIDYYENQFSIYNPTSEISQINQAAGQKIVSVSTSTFDLVKLAKKISLKAWGFNAAIGPLVKEWNVGFQTAHRPSENKIKQLLQQIDPQKIEIKTPNLIGLQQAGMQLDLGGIAKGYIADRLKNLWAAFGIQTGIINLGGNLLTIGNSPIHPDQKWRIGIQDPWNLRGKALRVARMPACSAVTSGIYERNFTEKQHFYHHILDSQTGYPLKTQLMSVTVFTDQSVWGEIESTRLFFNPEITLDELKKDRHFMAAVFIYQNHKIQILK